MCAAVDALSDVLPATERLHASEVGDGNLNLVFIIEGLDNPQHSVVLKQALPYLRVAGDSWPLTRERMRFETAGAAETWRTGPGSGSRNLPRRRRDVAGGHGASVGSGGDAQAPGGA